MDFPDDFPDDFEDDWLDFPDDFPQVWLDFPDDFPEDWSETKIWDFCCLPFRFERLYAGLDPPRKA